MKPVTVRAVPWHRGWELHIDGVGVTQVARLADATEQIRDYVETPTGHRPLAEDIAIDPDLGELGTRLAQSRHRAEQAASDQRAAAAATRGVIQQLIAAGIRATDIAFLLGISRARVAQLAKG